MALLGYMDRSTFFFLREFPIVRSAADFGQLQPSAHSFGTEVVDFSPRDP